MPGRKSRRGAAQRPPVQTSSPLTVVTGRKKGIQLRKAAAEGRRAGSGELGSEQLNFGETKAEAFSFFQSRSPAQHGN